MICPHFTNPEVHCNPTYVEPHPYWVYFIHPDMGWQRAGTWGSEVEAFAEVEYWQEKGFEAYVVQVAVT